MPHPNPRRLDKRGFLEVSGNHVRPRISSVHRLQLTLATMTPSFCRRRRYVPYVGSSIGFGLALGSALRLSMSILDGGLESARERCATAKAYSVSTQDMSTEVGRPSRQE